MPNLSVLEKQLLPIDVDNSARRLAALSSSSAMSQMVKHS